MNITQTEGALKKFRRTPWRFQQTFQTPLKDLDRFVSIILSACGEVTEASVTIHEIVFEPKHLNKLLSPGAPIPESAHGISIVAATSQEVPQLLRAALADWVDFLFVPTPKPFVIFADHDEYATFYANTKSNLNRVVEPLTSNGFKVVKDWERKL